MRIRIPFLFTSLWAAVQLSGCQKIYFDPSLAGTFFPLRAGLSWTYRIIDHNRGATYILTDRVVGATRVPGADAIEVESQYAGPSGPVDSSLLYFAESGYFTRQSQVGKSVRFFPAERRFLPQLLKPNLTWSNTLVPFDQDMFYVTQTHRTFFDTKTIEVPAGHFSGCIRIETAALYQSSSENNHPLNLKYVDWYAPHVGLVKTVVEQDGFLGSELARVELLNFAYPRPMSTPASTISALSASLRTSFDSRMLPQSMLAVPIKGGHDGNAH
jgi:hypothetical protein